VAAYGWWENHLKNQFQNPTPARILHGGHMIKGCATGGIKNHWNRAHISMYINGHMVTIQPRALNMFKMRVPKLYVWSYVVECATGGWG
jgi:hypothetical protein